MGSPKDTKATAMIRERLIHARKEHPSSEWEGKGAEWALCALLDEVDEVIDAYENGTEAEFISEVADTCSVGERIINKEYK